MQALPLANTPILEVQIEKRAFSSSIFEYRWLSELEIPRRQCSNEMRHCVAICEIGASLPLKDMIDCIHEMGGGFQEILLLRLQKEAQTTIDRNKICE